MGDVIKTRLSVKFFWVLLAGVIFFFGILIFLIIKRETTQMLDIYKRHASDTANLVYGHLNEVMFEAKTEKIIRYLDMFNADPNLTVGIFGPDGRPVFNTSFSAPPEILKTEEEASIKSESELIFYKPIQNEQRCHKCHSPLDKTRGMIIIKNSLDKLSSEIKETTWRLILFAIFLGLTSELFLIHILRKFVIKPLNEITSGAETLTRGELDYRVTLKRNDELGTLANAFNQMAERIQTAHVHLEDAVSQRTKELRVIAGLPPKTFRGDLTLRQVLEQFLNVITDDIGYGYSAICLVDRETGLLLQEFKKGITAGLCSLEIPLSSNHPLAVVVRSATPQIKNAEEINAPSDFGRVAILPLMSHQRKRCREVNHCTYTACPAFDSPDERCWLIEGTLCRSPRAVAGKEKIYGCLYCDAFPVLGVLIAGRKEADILKTSLHSLEILAPEITSAVENQRFIEAKKADIINLIKLHNISVEKIQYLNMDALKHSITTSALAFAGMDAAVLYLRGQDGKLYLEGACNVDIGLIPHSLTMEEIINSSSIGRAITQDRAIETIELKDVGKMNDLIERHGFLYMASLPLKFQDTIEGFILLFKKKDFFMTDPEKIITSLFINQSAAALNAACLYNKLRIEKEFSDAILNNMSTGAMTLDNEGRILRLNQTGFKILKIDDSIIGERLEEALPEAMPLLVLGPSLDREIEIGPNNIPIGFNNSALLDATGQRTGTVVIFQDLTEIKKLRLEIRKKQHFEAIGKVIAGVAHEIRNPLFGISSLVQIMERETIAPEQQALLKAIVKEASRMKNLVEELLIYSRPSKLNITDIDLAVFLEKKRHYINAKRDDVNLDINIPSLFQVRADADKLTQVFLNLIDNSLNANCQNINVSAQRQMDKAIITIRDDGKGIKKEFIDKIFDPFFTTRKEGTGLGLSVCKKLIEDHSGTIEIESKEGSGTTVVLTLKA